MAPKKEERPCLIFTWQQLQDELNSDAQAGGSYIYGMAQQLDIKISMFRNEGALLLQYKQVESEKFDADDGTVLETLGAALEFFSKIDKLQRPALEAKVSALQGEVERLRQELAEVSASAMDADAKDYDSDSWAKFTAELQKKAEEAGGNLEFYGRTALRYFRCPQLKHASIADFSPILLHEPHHNGQHHRFWFALPQDLELLKRLLDHDVELYQKLKVEQPPNGPK